MKNKILNVLFGDWTVKRWISYILIVCGIINITLSFFNEDMRWIALGLGTFSLAFGIGGYFNPPKS
ncbi:uncharacterized protein METZ01_LOCUS227342 [marine metagenome]|jgi:hypothetical protein|uniref:Uncharacterized protein n=1 Tax=marine metagenome TaxID=408172 RepID=A0A382GH35_9ZZZZ|tara:strand:+ start:375 stop:572 length:198 start_codon:yes stop_codon:yes gene_type:complete